MITIRNDFHNTEATVNARIGDHLMAEETRCIRAKLCDIPGCRCGGVLSESGPQDNGMFFTITKVGVLIEK